MNLIRHVAITDAEILSTDVPEDDTYSAWASGTTYALGDVVYLAATHRRYQSAGGSNAGNDPATDDGTWWTDIGATTKFRPFDSVVGAAAERAGSLTYTLQPGRFFDAVWLGNVVGSVSVIVRDAASAIVFQEDRDLVDRSDITDWLTFFTWDPVFESDALFTGFNGYADHTIEVTVTAATARLGEMVLGKIKRVGTTLNGPTMGIQDFSQVERDLDGGTSNIVERPYIDEFTLPVAVSVGDEARVRKLLAERRATATVIFASVQSPQSGVTIFGFPRSWTVTSQLAGVSRLEVTIEGVI